MSAMRSRLLSPGHVVIGVNLSELAPVIARQGRLAEAESTLLRSLAILRAHEREGHYNVRQARQRLADVYHEMGREDDARRQLAYLQGPPSPVP